MSTTRRTQADSGEPLAYSLKQAARAAGLSRQTMSKHLEEIPHRRIGGRILISKTALQHWLEGHDFEEAA